MAVFLINICKYNGCGITFPSLPDLIQHIEDTHIDYDPKVVEQKEQAQPACLPLSYVLRFVSEDARKEIPFLGGNSAGVELKRKLAIKHHSYSMSSSNRSNTPTGSEMDEDEMIVSESEDSNDSWTTEEFSSDFIMRHGSRHSGSGNSGAANEKPYACPVPGCKKRYKNVNGIKYHSKNGHKKDGKVRKGYKCHCGKSYKTAQGLKNHAMVAHNSSPDSCLTAQQVINTSNTAVIMQRSTSPSQSLGSLSPSSISNMSSSASSCHGGGNSTPNGSNNVLQHLATNGIGGTTNMIGNNGITCLTTSNNAVNTIALQSQQAQTQTLQSVQQHQQQQLTAISAATGNTSNLVRSTIGLVSIKANNNTVSAVGKTTAATNLLAANAAASKILKLATNTAAAAVLTASHPLNADTIQQQQQNQHHKLHQVIDVGSKHQQSKHQPSQTSTKITLPSLVNLGILTPATSPTKTTQTAFHQQHQHQQHQLNVNSNTSLSNLLPHQKILDNGNNSSNNNNGSTKNSIFIVETTPQQQSHTHHTTTTTTTQTQSQQHQLPLTPVSPNSNNNSSISTATVVQQKNVNAITATLQQIKQNIVGSIHLTSVSLANSNNNNNKSTSTSNNNNISNNNLSSNGNMNKSIAIDASTATATSTANIVAVADAGINGGAANDET